MKTCIICGNNDAASTAYCNICNEDHSYHIVCIKKQYIPKLEFTMCPLPHKSIIEIMEQQEKEQNKQEKVMENCVFCDLKTTTHSGLCSVCHKRHHYHSICINKFKKVNNFFNNIGEFIKCPLDQKLECVHFSTGAVCGTGVEEDVRYDLISPIGLKRLAQTYAEGTRKYSEYNWELGIPVSNLINHALNHIYEYLSGNREEDHISHACWNLIAAMHIEVTHPELDTLRGPNCEITDEIKKKIEEFKINKINAAKL